jgi:hypothetical protein
MPERILLLCSCMAGPSKLPVMPQARLDGDLPRSWLASALTFAAAAWCVLYVSSLLDRDCYKDSTLLSLLEVLSLRICLKSEARLLVYE